MSQRADDSDDGSRTEERSTTWAEDASGVSAGGNCCPSCVVQGRGGGWREAGWGVRREQRGEGGVAGERLWGRRHGRGGGGD